MSDDTIYRALKDMASACERTAEGLGPRRDGCVQKNFALRVQSPYQAAPDTPVEVVPDNAGRPEEQATYAGPGRAASELFMINDHDLSVRCGLPERGTGAAVLPSANRSHAVHLDEIAARVTAGAHAILILDQAGWTAPRSKDSTNLSLLPLPPRAGAQPQEKSGSSCDRTAVQRIFKSFDDIVDHCCYAWTC